MRLWAITGGLGLCACNSVFGLDPTHGPDAATPIDAAFHPTRLSFLVGPSTDAADQGTPYVAQVTPDPAPRVAALGQTFLDTPYRDMGVVEYPPELVGTTWRLEYTPPGDVPHEVQWNPPDGAGHLIVPLFGRPARTEVPPNTGYETKMGTHMFPAGSRIYTTGYWTQTLVVAPTQNPSVDFSQTAALSGVKGAPDAAGKDVVLVAEYVTTGACTVAQIVGSALVPEIQNGTQQQFALTPNTESGSITFSYADGNVTTAQNRLKVALGGGDVRTRSGSEKARAHFGRTPHTQMPLFTQQVDGVPGPILITLATCDIAPGPLTTPNFSKAGTNLSFRGAMFTYAANDRVVDGATLRSSIATVAFESTLDNYVADFSVLLPINPRLGIHDLDTGSDDQPIENTVQELTFEYEDPTGSSRDVDYVEVTLHHLVGTAFEPVRVYVLPNPAVRTLSFDPSVMIAGDTYVFSIQTYRGRPDARTFDFQTVRSPQAVATVFTRTFKR